MFIALPNYRWGLFEKTLDKSFFSIASKQWDSLPPELKQTWDFTEFKEGLTTILKPRRCKLYNIGTRYANSIHTQLRVGCSNLNSHLFAIGRSSTQGCICNCPNESVEHVLLDCFMYQEERQVMFDYIKNTRNILCGKLETYNRKSLVSVLLKENIPLTMTDTHTTSCSSEQSNLSW